MKSVSTRRSTGSETKDKGQVLSPTQSLSSPSRTHQPLVSFSITFFKLFPVVPSNPLLSTSTCHGSTLPRTSINAFSSVPNPFVALRSFSMSGCGLYPIVCACTGAAGGGGGIVVRR